jgi:hexosaminidase
MLRLRAVSAVMLAGTALTSSAFAQTTPLALIPSPASVARGRGTFLIGPTTTVGATTLDRRARDAARLAASLLRIGVDTTTAARIVFDLRHDTAAAEAYELRVTPAGVHITAGGHAGLIWGLQTLRQLLPTGFDSATGAPQGGWRVPAVTIRDRPRFGWRGAMLDVGRHFFPIADVKRFIDLLSRYKLNVFHWHLTEDQGWRLQIRRWPRLTEVGAWRTEEDGSRYGGFYTQDEVREVVAYAAERGVMVVPEIELPGHASAAIASYPWLGCTGEPLAIPNGWGVFSDVLCPRDTTFAFLESVLDEVVALFPSPWIHIGGDEVPKDRWRACADCQALMRREGLASEEELQSWFIRRVGAMLAARGRRLIGWDEITEGGLPPGATVQVWRDTAFVRQVVRAGQDVIASPTSHAYINRSPGELPLATVYGFDPVPAGLTDVERSRVLGSEVTLWSEHITPANLDLQAFPRIIAFAEALWSTGPRDLAEFRARLDGDHRARLAALGVAMGPEDRDLLRLRPVHDTLTGATTLAVTRGIDGLEIRFTTDLSTPTATSPLYRDGTALPATGRVTLQAFYRGQALLDRRTLGFTRHLATGRPVVLRTPADARYPGTGSRTLTDGLLGSTDFHDGLWQGWQGPDLDATVDLGAAQAVREVEATFLQVTRSWILLPRSLTVWVSSDGLTWHEAGTATHTEPAERMEPFRHALRITAPEGGAVRYVRLLARSAGALPAWHLGRGEPSWVFADEIVVR